MTTRPRWRLFRQDAGRVAGPPPAVYVLLFVVCIALGQWSVQRFGAVYVWPANGVLLAAVLQLHRRQAILVLASCFAINLVGNVLRHEASDLIVLNAALNAGEAVIAGVIARRFCGAALDMRRPARLMRFAGMAVAPSVAVSALIGVPLSHTPRSDMLTVFQTYYLVESLGLLTVTPALLLLVRGHRFEGAEEAPIREKAALTALLVVVTAAVFAQSAASVLCLVFLPLLLIAFRLPPWWSALSVILVAVIGGGFTVNQHGPLILSRLGPDHVANMAVLPIVRALPPFQIFMIVVIGVALPANTALTERRRLEARLRTRTDAAIKARVLAEDAARAKARFLSVMSHEMRTPLNGVSGFAELLAARPCLDVEGARQVEQILFSAERLRTLMDDILDFSRDGGEVALAPFSLAAVIEEAVAQAQGAAEAKSLTLAVAGEIDPRVRHVGDARRLRQVLRLLLSNAVKFTDRGGVEVAARLRADGVEVSVADTGPGVAPQVFPTLFQPFSQADASISRVHDGVGMGLALAKRQVEVMGGEIRAGNGPAGGAVFAFSLPLTRADELETDVSGVAAAAGRAWRVLVVDDHPLNREVASLMLTAAGCEVAMACNGEEAVETARDWRCDLILMDVRMPRMDGLEATRRIRRLEGRAAMTPIVAFTADAMPEDVARCIEAGMQGHLAKPVSRARLREVLMQLQGEADIGADGAAQKRPELKL